jgi:hypothetical protein
MPRSVTHQGHTNRSQIAKRDCRWGRVRTGRNRYAPNCRCATQKRTTSYPNKTVTTAAKVSRNFAPITANTIVSAAYANTAARRKQRCRR